MSLPPSGEIPQGAIRFNTDSQRLEFYAQGEWWIMSTDTPNLGTSDDSTPGPRGVFPGGRSGGPTMTDDMDYINISSTGDALDFGDLITDSFEAGACSSSTRGVKFGGRVFPGSQYQDNLEAYNFASTGSIADIEDLRTATVYSCGASNETRGLIMGGLIHSSYGGSWSGGWNNIDYITIASFGESIEFGDLSFDNPGGMNQANSPTRGIFAGGFAPHNGPPGAPSAPSFTTTKIQFVTIPTLGNSQSFGDLINLTSYTSGAGNSIRGIYAGDGATPKTDIEVINISSTGNAVKFGDLEAARYAMAAVSSPTRVAWGGAGTYSNDISYVEIATGGTAVDFGNLTSNRGYQSGCSNAHGGL